MVNAKLYGYVNLKVKKEVAEIIRNLSDEYDITISDLLFDITGDKQLIRVTLEIRKNKNNNKIKNNNI